MAFYLDCHKLVLKFSVEDRGATKDDQVMTKDDQVIPEEGQPGRIFI